MNGSQTIDWNPAAPDVQRDFRAACDAMRRRCPVAYSELFGWSLFRHADVMQVLLDPETFSSAVSRHASVPNGMNPPEHTVYRRLIEPYFAPARMEAFEPACRRIAVQLVAMASDRGAFEVMDAVAYPFAARAQCAFLGWSESLSDVLIRWVLQNHALTASQNREGLSRHAVAYGQIIGGILESQCTSTADTTQDVTTRLRSECVNGQPLSVPALTSILRNWTVGEIGTLSASVGILLQFLAQHPDLQTHLRQERALIPTAIDEILRIHGPLATNRRVTTRPVEIGGRSIGAGERITIHWVAANRDETVFQDPDAFRLDRDPSKNLLFGAGIHVCPGAPLALLELRVFMEELLRQCSRVELDPIHPAQLAIYPASGYARVPLILR